MILIMLMGVEARESVREPYFKTPPRWGCRLPASVCGTSPPQAAPTSAALVVARKVRPSQSQWSLEFLSMATPLEHAGFW